jgi:hypothetical protein
MDNTSTILNTWGVFFDTKLYNVLHEFPEAPGRVANRIYYFSSPYFAISYVDNLWSMINAEFGTLFDFAEEEDISPDLCLKIAKTIRKFVKRYKRKGKISRQISILDGKSVIAVTSSQSIIAELNSLASFLEDMGEERVFLTAIF